MDLFEDNERLGSRKGPLQVGFEPTTAHEELRTQTIPPIFTTNLTQAFFKDNYFELL